jgi:hypothetical protein
LYINFIHSVPCLIPLRDVGLDCIFLNSCPNSMHFQTIHLSNVLDFFIFDVYSVLYAVEILQPTACAVYFRNFISTCLL